MNGASPTDPELRQAEVQGARLAYTDEGPRDAPVVVTIHGTPGSVRDFRYLAPALLPDIRVVRVDLPGFGGSARPRNGRVTFDARVDAVLGLADALSLDRFCVFGHSMGGGTALVLGERIPQRVSLLVLVASVSLRQHRGLGLSPAAFAVLRQAVRVPGIGHAVVALIRRAYKQRNFAGADRLGRDEAAFQLSSLAATDFARLRRAAKATLPPVVVAHADDDRLVERAVSEELGRAIPGATVLEFSEGGHNLQKSRAGELAAIIRERLR